MKALHTVSLITASMLAAAAFAGEEVQTKMKMIVVDDSADGEMRIELDSDDVGFNLHDMQVGENQSIVDAEGRSILVTREEDGFAFDIDGKTVRLPALDGDHERVWVHKGSADADVDVHVIHEEEHEHDGEDIRIIKKTIEIKAESPEA